MKFFDKIGKFIFRGDPDEFVLQKNLPENFPDDFSANLRDFSTEIENENLTKKGNILLAEGSCFDENGDAVSCGNVVSDAGNFFEDMETKPLNLKLENTKNGFELFHYGKKITPEKTKFGWKISTELEAGFFNTKTEKYKKIRKKFFCQMKKE